MLFFCRCGLRGGYIELVGLSDQVKSRIKMYLSARNCSSTIGQVRKITPVIANSRGNEKWSVAENVIMYCDVSSV